MRKRKKNWTRLEMNATDLAVRPLFIGVGTAADQHKDRSKRLLASLAPGYCVLVRGGDLNHLRDRLRILC
jgi:hypothetical protein